MAAKHPLTGDGSVPAGRILELIPQKPPFRFIDSIVAIGNDTIRAEYRFSEDHDFYRGHFPGNPVTPGVILVEAMAQTGVVALGIYLLLREGMPESELQQITTLFAFADEIEFSGIVYPGEKIVIYGEKIYLRRGNLKTRCHITRENGETVCSGVLTGTGVTR